MFHYLLFELYSTRRMSETGLISIIVNAYSNPNSSNAQMSRGLLTFNVNPPSVHKYSLVMYALGPKQFLK